MSTPAPPAARYEHFRNEVFAGLNEPAPLLWPEPMNELQLQSQWFAGLFGTEFTSTDGERVLIRDFGTWNAGAGPDFTGCTVIIDGETLSGDIELDRDVRDWERHQHGTNAAFNRVVLHLYMDEPAQGRSFTRTQEHRAVPQVKLTAHMLEDPFQKPGPLAAARLGRCALPLSQMPEQAVEALIECAAQHRLLMKSRRMHRCVAAQGRDQALCQALAQALGYKQNQRPFTVLAQRLPLRQLLALAPEPREALLFGVAGWLDANPYDEARDDARPWLRSIWQHWWKQRAHHERWLTRNQELHWSLSAVRPGNHPQRRLGAFAAMLEHWSEVSAPLKPGVPWNRERWCQTLQQLTHPFWSTHYTLTSAPAQRPIAILGATRVQEMLANVVYPLLLPEQPAIWAEYLTLPAMLDNQKVQRACLRLFGDSPRNGAYQKRLHHQQGLLQIYEDFCLEDHSGCTDCPFPERLAQWQV